MKIKGNKLIVQNSQQSHDFAQSARQFIEKHLAAPKSKPKQKAKPKMEIAIDRKLIGPIVKVLNGAGLSKKDFAGMKGLLLKKGADAIALIRRQNKLPLASLTQLELVFQTGN